AISPVIATVIIVAVTITVAIAVAYWMGGIAGLYTRFEQLEITQAYVTKENDGWLVHIAVKNKGSASATIDDILINGVPLSQIPDSKAANATTSFPTIDEVKPDYVDNISISLDPGETVYISVYLKEGASVGGTGTLSSGVSIEVKLHTAAGKEYPKLLTLP
ncbi:MAG: DUF4352 domain-containing protein, partial [Thermoprotei archaeon]